MRRGDAERDRDILAVNSLNLKTQSKTRTTSTACEIMQQVPTNEGEKCSGHNQQIGKLDSTNIVDVDEGDTKSVENRSCVTSDVKKPKSKVSLMPSYTPKTCDNHKCPKFIGTGIGAKIVAVCKECNSVRYCSDKCMMDHKDLHSKSCSKDILNDIIIPKRMQTCIDMIAAYFRANGIPKELLASGDTFKLDVSSVYSISDHKTIEIKQDPKDMKFEKLDADNLPECIVIRERYKGLAKTEETSLGAETTFIQLVYEPYKSVQRAGAQRKLQVWMIVTPILV